MAILQVNIECFDDICADCECHEHYDSKIGMSYERCLLFGAPLEATIDEHTGEEDGDWLRCEECKQAEIKPGFTGFVTKPTQILCSSGNHCEKIEVQQ